MRDMQWETPWEPRTCTAASTTGRHAACRSMAASASRAPPATATASTWLGRTAMLRSMPSPPACTPPNTDVVFLQLGASPLPTSLGCDTTVLHGHSARCTAVSYTPHAPPVHLPHTRLQMSVGAHAAGLSSPCTSLTLPLALCPTVRPSSFIQPPPPRSERPVSIRTRMAKHAHASSTTPCVYDASVHPPVLRGAGARPSYLHLRVLRERVQRHHRELQSTGGHDHLHAVLLAGQRGLLQHRA